MKQRGKLLGALLMLAIMAAAPAAAAAATNMSLAPEVRVYGVMEAYGTVDSTMPDYTEMLTLEQSIVGGLRPDEKAGLWLYANFTNMQANGVGAQTLTITGTRT